MEQVAVSNTRLTGARVVMARIAWVIITSLVLGLFLISIPVEYQTHLTQGSQSFGSSLTYLGLTVPFFAGFRTFMDISLAMGFIIIGIFIFFRKSDDWIVILTSLTNQTFIALFVPTFTFLVLYEPAWRPLVNFIRALGLASSLIVFFYLIPNGHFIPRWTRWLAALWGLIVMLWLVFPNIPANLVQMSTWESNIQLSFVIFFSAYATGIFAQIYRYRRVSGPVQRQQTKWFVFGITAGFVGFALYHLPLVLLPAVFGHPGLPRLLHIFFGIPIYHLLVFLAPLCVAICVMRYRLWDIDHLINRTILYSTLTVILTLVYFSIVILLEMLIRNVFWIGQDILVTVISTLAIAALFIPLRQRTQMIIDRSFYRKRYNTEKTLTALSASLREEVDLNSLIDRLLLVVQETMQPAHISLWLTSDYLKNWTTPKGIKLTPIPQFDLNSDDPIVYYSLSNPDIIKIDHLSLDSPALQILRLAGVKVSVPLVNQGQLIGLLNLGPRRSEQGYSVDDRHLLNILASQAAPALKVAALVRQQQDEVVKRERMDYELKVARRIQQTFLPKQLPNIPHWQTAAHYQPAIAVGGDFYDFHQFPDGRFAIIIGDVTDHGIPAALVMVDTRAILRDSIRLSSSPGAILEHANEMLCSEIPTSMFVTCLVAILEPGRGRLQFANAGQNLPLRSIDGRIQELRATGMPLGIMQGVHYEENETIIGPGESILFFSDGLVEAHNSSRDMFGDERLKEIVSNHTINPQSLINTLLSEMVEFTGQENEQEDDVTLVALYHSDGVINRN